MPFKLRIAILLSIASSIIFLSAQVQCQNEISKITFTSVNNLMEQGHYSEAVKVTSKFLESSPKSWWLLYIRSTANERLGHVQESMNDINAAILLNPKSETLLTARGVYFSTQHKFAEAHKDYLSAYEISPKSYPTQLNLGEVLVELGRDKEGLKYLNQAIATAPELSGEPYFYRAKVFKASGDETACNRDLQKSKSMKYVPGVAIEYNAQLRKVRVPVKPFN